MQSVNDNHHCGLSVARVRQPAKFWPLLLSPDRPSKIYFTVCVTWLKYKCEMRKNNFILSCRNCKCGNLEICYKTIFYYKSSVHIIKQYYNVKCHLLRTSSKTLDFLPLLRVCPDVTVSKTTSSPGRPFFLVNSSDKSTGGH